MPELAVIEQIIEETWDTKTFRAVFKDAAVRERFTYEPGAVPGGLRLRRRRGDVLPHLHADRDRASSSSRVKQVGARDERAARACEAGDRSASAGRYGNCFPYESVRGKNLLFIGGGIGMAPLRSLSELLPRPPRRLRQDRHHLRRAHARATSATRRVRGLAQRARHQPVPDRGRGRRDLDRQRRASCRPTSASSRPSPADAVAITCGPPIMIKFTLPELERSWASPTSRSSPRWR